MPETEDKTQQPKAAAPEENSNRFVPIDLSAALLEAFENAGVMKRVHEIIDAKSAAALESVTRRIAKLEALFQGEQGTAHAPALVSFETNNLDIRLAKLEQRIRDVIAGRHKSVKQD